MPRKFTRSFEYAWAGGRHALRTQRNIWAHLFIGTAAAVFAILLRVSLTEMAVIVMTLSFVIVAEIFNTAIEEVVNLMKPETHPQAALIKDIAAAAVLASAMGAVIIGGLIFVPRLL